MATCWFVFFRSYFVQIVSSVDSSSPVKELLIGIVSPKVTLVQLEPIEPKVMSYEMTGAPWNGALCIVVGSCLSVITCIVPFVTKSF